MFKKTNALFLLLLPLFFSCEKNDQAVIRCFNQHAVKIQKKYAPDLSLNIFKVNLNRDKNNWILQGETTVPDAKTELLILADSLLGKNCYEDSLLELPDPAFGDARFALVKVCTAHLRRTPKHAAELVDQAIMGGTLRLLKRHNGWYQVQTDYDYIGWVEGGSIFCTDAQGISNWKEAGRARVTVLFAMIYSQPDIKSTPVMNVVLNANLMVEKKGKIWTEAQTPDGRKGFIKTCCIELLKNKKKNKKITAESIIKTARSMMGISYLWGGNSSVGNDCSGFVQIVFKANGIQLPRDARQQILSGKEIVPDETFSNILPGDLFFFGAEKRVTHVGISLGGAAFIHQSSEVHINSLDPQAENYSDYRKNTFKTIKRIL